LITLQISHTVQTSAEHGFAASHCLALSYWRSSWRFIRGTFPKWPISTVMDAWFYYAKMALSPPLKLLSQVGWWAYSVSSDILSLSLSNIPQMETTESLILRRAHFPRNKCIPSFAAFVSLCSLWPPPFFPVSFPFVCVCHRSHVCFFGNRVYKHMFSCMRSCSILGVSAEQKTMIAFSPWCCFTLLFYALDAIPGCLETQLSIISIIAGKLQSAFDLLLIFLLLVTLKWIEQQRSRNYRVMCSFVCASWAVQYDFS